jgi:hypothetical protein
MKPHNGNAPLVDGYIRGVADAKLKDSDSLDTVCGRIIPHFNLERFETIAIRIFFGKESFMTVYALDKMHKSSVPLDGKKLPVKKFKLELPAETIIQLFSNLNLTIKKGDHNIEEIEVLNK